MQKGVLALGVTWAVTLVVACGARSSLHPLESSPDGSAGGTSSDAGTDAPEDAPPPCTTWSLAPGDPIPLTDPIGDSALTSVAVEGDRVFIATTNNNDPSPDPTWRVRVVSADLSTIGPSQVVLSRPQGVSFSGLSVANGGGHRGGIAWDDADGCRFIALAGDGAAAAAPLPIATTWCYWLLATSGGFDAFVSPIFQLAPLSLFTLDAAGNVVGTKPDLVPAMAASTFPLSRVRFDDGSILLAWVTDSSSITVQRFTETGDALTPPKELLPFNNGTRFALGSMGGSALAAWAPGDAAPGEVRALPLDANGDPLGPPFDLAPAPMDTIGSVSVGAAGGAALVAWTQGAPGAASLLTVQPVTPSGEPDGALIAVPTPAFLGSVRVVGTPAGALLAFDAEAPQTLTQVFVTRLVCDR